MPKKMETKWAAIGMNPPGDSDGEFEYIETVRNMVVRHREALAGLSDPYAKDDHKAFHQEQADAMKAALDSVDKADLDAALALIDHAESFPQHVAAIGQEPVAPEGSEG